MSVYVLTDRVRLDEARTRKSLKFGSACWARTSDPLINSQVLVKA